MTAGSANGEQVVNSICQMCGSSCRISVKVRAGKIVNVELADNNTDFCPRWRAITDFVYHPDRLQYPVKRRGPRGGGDFERISWDEALDTVAEKLLDTRTRYGPESAVFYVGYPKDPRPYYHRLAHAFGSPNYCTESSNCFLAAWVAGMLNYGRDFAMSFGPFGIADNPTSVCNLIWGSGVKQSNPPVWKRLLKARDNGLKIIVVDPRRSDAAKIADMHLQPRPGTDGALALGMINVIIGKNLYDMELMSKWSIGFDELKQLASRYTLQQVEKITQVPANLIREAAILYATSKPASLACSIMSTTHTPNGVQNHRAITLLPALTGNLGIPGGQQVFTHGAALQDISLHDTVSEMPPGLGTDRFPIWTNLSKEMQANVLADRIESADPYPIRTLIGAGLNLMFFPNTNRFVKNLNKLDFYAAVDFFLNPGAQLADIVLPIATCLERPMLQTFGGPFRWLEPAIEPVGECRPEFDIIAGLAKRLGLGDQFWNGDFERCVEHMLEPTGVTLADLKQTPDGIAVNPPSKPLRHYEQAGFGTPSGKIEISSSVLAEHGYEPLPVYTEPSESPVSQPELAKEFPLVMTSGARRIAYTHSQYRNIEQLRKIVPEATVEINPTDATARGINSGDSVSISSLRGSIRVKADVSDVIMPGCIALPHHWPGDANANLLVDDQTPDPISGFTPCKSQLCQVAKA
ncbi:molybdopterin-dependent oxidoreductase [Chloroflexota bacterium]